MMQIRYSPARRRWHSPHPCEWRHEAGTGDKTRTYIAPHYTTGWQVRGDGEAFGFWGAGNKQNRATLRDVMIAVDSIESRLILVLRGGEP